MSCPKIGLLASALLLSGSAMAESIDAASYPKLSESRLAVVRAVVDRSQQPLQELFEAGT